MTIPRFSLPIYRLLFLLACGLVLSVNLVSCYSSSYISPRAENGVIRLNQWDFEKYGPATLDGIWRFAWKELISPQNADLVKDGFAVPGKWSGRTTWGVPVTQEGFGTYALTIHLPETDQPFAFYLPIIGHASSIWINGTLVHQTGKVSDSRETMKAEISRDVFSIDPSSTRLELVMQVSNFVHRTGGIDASILFGPEKQIMQIRTRNVFFEAFLTGSLVFTGILHIMIAILFGNKRASLLFAIICFDFAVRNLLTGEQLLAYLIPSLPWSLEYKLEYLTAFSLAVPLIASFIYDLFPLPRSKHFLTIIIGIGLLTGIFIISSPVHTFSRFMVVFNGLVVIQSLYIGYLLIYAMNNRLQGSGVLLSGGIILFVAAISDMLFYQGQIHIGPMAVVGFWFFLLCQAFALAIQFMNAYNRLKRNSLNLEWQVNERTRNLQKANQDLQEQIQEKEKIEEQLRTLSRTDPLTKIDNRYRFNETLDEEIRRVNRYEGSLSIIMFDIDHFKQINDTYGHDIGDKVLVKIAHLVENMIRDIDRFARWGGEEFIILIPNNDVEGATMLAERIRAAIEESGIPPVKELTASFGVVEYRQNEEKTSLLKRVDEALYAAKFKGRNRVVNKNENKPTQ